MLRNDTQKSATKATFTVYKSVRIYNFYSSRIGTFNLREANCIAEAKGIWIYMLCFSLTEFQNSKYLVQNALYFIRRR